MSAGIWFNVRVWLDQPCNLTPVANAGDHVFPNTQPDQGVVFKKECRALMNPADSLFKPAVSEYERLMPSELIFQISDHGRLRPALIFARIYNFRQQRLALRSNAPQIPTLANGVETPAVQGIPLIELLELE